MHNSLMGVLNGLKNDCTHNQNKFKTNLNLSKPGFCHDLKNATDRVPISLQKRILSKITSKEISEAWERILIGLPYDTPKGKISYVRGQPMGAFTSFPMFALTHHIIIRIAAYRVGITRFDDYAVLGDDVIILNKLVSDSYLKLMDLLDVEISMSKSYSGNTIEFAKRHFYKGEEFTGFSVNALEKTWKSYPLFLNFLEQMGSRDYFQEPAKSSLSFVESIYNEYRP
jgi:hypothetical protein